MCKAALHITSGSGSRKQTRKTNETASSPGRNDRTLAKRLQLKKKLNDFVCDAFDKIVHGFEDAPKRLRISITFCFASFRERRGQITIEDGGTVRQTPASSFGTKPMACSCCTIFRTSQGRRDTCCPAGKCRFCTLSCTPNAAANVYQFRSDPP